MSDRTYILVMDDNALRLRWTKQCLSGPILYGRGGSVGASGAAIFAQNQV